jgi:hypothetical protein
LSLSSFLLVYLVLPQRKIEIAKREQEDRPGEPWKERVLTVYGHETVHQRILTKESLGTHKHLPGPM